MLTIILSAALAVDDPAALHRRLLVVDTHADTPQRFVDEGWDLAAPLGPGHLDLATARAGNLGGEFFSIYVDAERYAGHYRARADALIDSVLEQVRRHPEVVAARRGPHPRLAALMGLEGGHAIENDLGVLEAYYRRGVRYMTLTHSKSNEWAGSSGDAAGKPPRGLTPFGVQVVQTMNRLGMMVDISHVSDATFADVLKVTHAPVIASHSSARDVPRNMTDDMLRAVARNGGVVQVNFFSAFVDPAYAKAFTAHEANLRAEHESLVKMLAEATPAQRALAERRLDLEQGARFPRPPMSRVIEHIDHIAKVAGVDHVGIGSDFDGIPSAPTGLDTAADLPKITAALLARGYGEHDLEKIMGGNLLRVMRDVEKVARGR